MNPFKNMNALEARAALKEVLAKRRTAKMNNDRGMIKKCNDEQGMLHQRLRFLAENHTPTEAQVMKREMKEEDRRERISKFGFAITSHALHRYRLRFDPTMTMEQLYKKMQSTDLPQYLKIKTTGECGVQGNMVAVVKNKLILTFKDVQE